LLTGVMLSSMAMAGVSLVLSLAPSEQLRGMLFWMMGDLSGTDVPAPCCCCRWPCWRCCCPSAAT
jgi:iron complex transport system permease protein